MSEVKGLARTWKERAYPLPGTMPEPIYAWKLVKTIPGNGVTSYVLDLKSQTWRSAPEVDRPVWQHWLTITKPDKVVSDTALLSIGGGRCRSASVPAKAR